MTIIEIEKNLDELLADFKKESFIYDLLLAYGTPKSTIKRVQGSDHDRLSTSGELILRKKLFFKVADKELHATIDTLKTAKEVIKHSPRFIIVTDYETLLAYDTKTDDSLDTELLNIINHYDFFLPLAGMEKATFADENPADVKASLKMAKLYDELQKNNHFETKEDIHSLNVFLTRLLFCYFAEDTNIFPDNAVTSSIASHTSLDGSDVEAYLSRLFKIFNTPENQRDKNTPSYLSLFPYVNGGLFRDEFTVPKFTSRSRRILLEVGQLEWSQINPDIFGSMIQAVVTPQHRGGMGMHYTSVPNIMKVIEPLFLDELYMEFEKAYESKAKLQNLLKRLSYIKIFDPACGSGNFLIIAYKKLRELEMSILKRLDTLSSQKSFVFSEIKLTQFYGIELDDFAHEVAILSLWLAEHQMNLEFYKAFGRTSPSLPLHEGGNVVQGNATRLEWEDVCPKNKGDEIYVLGNPPYLGGKSQSKEQKEDMVLVFKGIKFFKELDYIACWFYLASRYISKKQRFAFVTTTSICEGAQVEQLWPHVQQNNNEIYFTFKSFNWTNNAKDKAGVTVTIIGISKKDDKLLKYIYTDAIKQSVDNINGYLVNAKDVYITKKNKSISNLPSMITGNSPYEGGNLMLTYEEKEELLNSYSEAEVLIRKTYGSNEYINHIDRWCLWIENNQLELALSIPPLKKRIEKIRELRENGGDVARGLVNRPHQFRYTHTGKTSIIIIPIVSSSRREYIPFGIVPKETIILSSAAAIYDTEIYVFGILTSKIHMAWVKLTAGKLRGDIRYLSALNYNTFPFPNISQKQKEMLTELVFGILDEREKHSQKTLAALYDPDKMPEGLRKAHHTLDTYIEQCYRSKPFESDEERLEYLFKMYEEMTSKDGKK